MKRVDSECRTEDEPCPAAHVMTPDGASGGRQIPLADASKDVDAILDAFGLQAIRRFRGQMHWREETVEANRADDLEAGLKLENVAAHSWHVADAILLLADHFPNLDVARCVSLAILHDKLELYTGDFDPVGPDGRGSTTHAFDTAAQRRKEEAERAAMERYLARLRPAVRNQQRGLLTELIDGRSAEARFVRAVDKLQALAFVVEKKGGGITDEHVRFTLRYSKKATVNFPGLGSHRRELVSRLMKKIAEVRTVPLAGIESRFREHLEIMA